LLRTILKQIRGILVIPITELLRN